MRIALDAMGGDFAPERPVAAALEALQRFPAIDKLFLVGNEDLIRAELAKHSCAAELSSRYEIRHCTQVVEMSDGAVEGIRKKKDNSISRSVELVRDGLADAVISAGHTGAMVAATTIRLRTLPGIDRPAIATILPTATNLFLLIDAGANIDARPRNLAEYALMGTIYSKEVLKYPNPRVGLLSIGTEDVKGNDLTKETFKLLHQAPKDLINFVGNIEGHDLFERPVEIVLTDGFVGNVVLKTSESISSAIFHWLKSELTKTPFRMFGAWLARNAFRAIRKKTNYEEYGGSLLLGVNGIAVIAHGSSTVKAIRNAIRVCLEANELKINPLIIKGATRLSATLVTESEPHEAVNT